MKTIVVIGGGITGLSAAYDFQKWKMAKNSNVKLILAEASDRLGGKIQSIKRDGFIMETGADSIVARKADTMSFIEELGLEQEVVYNATGRSFIYTEGELKLIPEGSVFGIPGSIESLAKSTLVSAEGKVEALKDLYIDRNPFTKEDSIGDFLEYYFGEELVRKQIGPVLSGVYSGDLSDLTISATLPYLLDYKVKYGSIIKGLEANKAKFQGSGAKFISFKNGLDSLIKAYEKKLNHVSVLKNSKAEMIEKADGRYLISFSNQKKIAADYIVLSVPYTAAETLISDLEIQQEFASLKSSSLTSVYMGFDVSDDLLPKDGTGFITSSHNELSCNACTWTSKKWKHTSKEGNLLVRLFYKSNHPFYKRIKNMSNEEFLQNAVIDIEKSMGIRSKPVVSEVTNWLNGMPNYRISHPKSVQAIEKQLTEKYPGVHLAGCSYYGVGIPDCIRNGKEIAKKILGNL